MLCHINSLSRTLSQVLYLCPSLPNTSLNTISLSLIEAVPVPAPTPVAVNTVPTVLAEAPIPVKLVVPTDKIVYV